VKKLKLKFKKLLFALSLLVIVFFYANIVKSSLTPQLPKPGNFAYFYSNKSNQSLRQVVLNSIKKAKKSIHLISFGLSDNAVINLLNEKATNPNIDVKVFFDQRSTPKNINLPEKICYSVNKSGLLHQKVIVIDEKIVFLGSCNFTKSSFFLHDNLIIGFFSNDLAKFLIKHTPFASNHHKSMIGGQDLDVYLLPDNQNYALKKLLNLIKHSSKSIQIAMFSFTHPYIVQELVNAKKRGVFVRAIIDKNCANSYGKKAIYRLNRAKIGVSISKGKKLFHHKYMIIDDRILVSGSANFTKSAFEKNYDLFFVLYNLNKKQKTFLSKIWKSSLLETY